MKTSTLASIALLAASACPSMSFAQARPEAITLEACEKLVTATFGGHGQVVILTRPMRRLEKAETYRLIITNQPRMEPIRPNSLYIQEKVGPSCQ